MIIQGRTITYKDIEWIRQLMKSNPTWHRTRLSKEICLAWDWVTDNGQLKDIACRSLLRKLEERGYITLPKRQRVAWSGYKKRPQPVVDHDVTEISDALSQVSPVRVLPVEETGDKRLFSHLLDKYHYLGYHAPVGKHMKYMAYDIHDRPLGCLLFGSSAWRVDARDKWIGWNEEARKAHLHFTTNNTRFLIFPWVRIPHLASHLLGQVSRRLSADWMEKYAHPIYLLETFVERDRFKGTSYQAANWQCIGQTKGRSRNDRYSKLQVPIKDIYLYPVHRNYREALCNGQISGHAHQMRNKS